MSVSTFLRLSLFIFFFVIVFLGFLPLLIERFRNFKRFQMSILLALVSAALPLTMGVLLQKNGFLTQASTLERPRNLQIVNVHNLPFLYNGIHNIDKAHSENHHHDCKPEAVQRNRTSVIVSFF